MITELGVHYSSAKADWETPQAFFALLDGIFRFTLDACATPDNAKCDKFFTPDEDCLRQNWHGVVWMNPPYGSAIGAFMRKAFVESQRGATVVCLVPARTDTRWWHEYVKRGTVIFLRGRQE